MNEFQSRLYDNLMTLCEAPDVDEAFYFMDQEHNNKQYRIFTYRLASYSDFCLPGARECRGHTFEMEDGHPVDLVSLPMQKFFNWKENPFTMFERFENVSRIEMKEDGSLISVSMDRDGDMLIKSKQSFRSEHALASREMIMDRLDLYCELSALGKMGYTVNMEYKSPEHRIVVGYYSRQLTVLNIRSTLDGNYLSQGALSELGYFPAITRLWVKDFIQDPFTDTSEPHNFITSVKDAVGFEGYVVWMGNEAVKIKSDWYVTLHRAKDSINTPKKVMESILNESIDDLRSLFADDQGTLDYISDIESTVIPKYNHMISIVESFYEENKDLDQKSYAIKAKELGDGLMPLYMCMYNGKPFDYKTFAMKKYEQFLDKD